MKQRTYRQTWQKLTADQKRELAAEAETSYEYLKLIACKNGRCGRHLADAIASALISLGYFESDDPRTARAVLFPDLKSAPALAAPDQ